MSWSESEQESLSGDEYIGFDSDYDSDVDGGRRRLTAGHGAMLEVGLHIKNMGRVMELVDDYGIRYSSILALALVRGIWNSISFCIDAWPSSLKRKLCPSDFWWDEEGDAIECRDKGDYPLHMAAYRAPANVLRRMIESCPESILFRNARGRIPLMKVLVRSRFRRGQNLIEVVKLFLDAAPERMLAMRDKDGNVLLHYACSYGTAPVVRLVAGKYMKAIKTTNDRGVLPLHNAVENEEPNNSIESARETISFLVQSHPDGLAVLSEGGLPPLHLAVKCKADIAVIKCLLSLSSSPSDMIMTRDRDNGQTALHFAALFHDKEAFQFLANSAPMSCREQDDRGRLPLHHCIKCPEKTKTALSHFPEAASTEDEEGNTPLHLARHGTVAKILADAYPGGLSYPNRDGMTPVHVAVMAALPGSTTDVLEVLLEKDPTCLRQKCGRGMSPVMYVLDQYEERDEHSIKKLLNFLQEKDPDCLNTVDCDGATLIHRFAKNEDMESYDLMELLLKSHPSSASTVDRRGNLPLFYAAKYGSLNKIHILVRYCVEALAAPDKNSKKDRVDPGKGDGSPGGLRKRQREACQGISGEDAT